ncbi:HalOD1 output domain-containing protein [Halosimplex halophilum]|uniref:HalOD1 output domain-containing protein n=1 Tax=Halosimplex halophilum TaxID=2559572 RepID=UPI00107F84D7|nr:HalOD1 output domain-containing protein [Halosimplex halophilum]
MTSIIETSESESVSQQVIAEVAVTAGKDPLEMEPLYTRVDPDCLEAIFSDDAQMATREHGQISFPMAGCHVVVEANGTINVTERGEPAETAVPSGQASGASNAAESPD